MNDIKEIIRNYLKATNNDITITEKEFQAIQSQCKTYSKMAFCKPLKVWRDNNILCIEWDIKDGLGRYEWYHYTYKTWY